MAMTWIAALVCGVAAIVMVPGEASAQKKFSGVTLNINGYGGEYDEILKRTIAAPLKEKYGLEVVYQPGGSTAATARLLASKEDPPFDLLMADSPAIPALVKAGVLDTVSVKDAPNLAKVYPQLREFGEYGAPFSIASLVLTYNSKSISVPPKSVKDLARADFKDKLGIFDLGSTGGVLFLMAMAQAEGGSIANLDPGFALLRRIKPNVVSSFGATVPHVQAFQQGEASAGVLWDGRVYELQTKNVPMVKVVPEEGIFSVISYVNAVKGTKHREAVMAYIDQALSDEAIGALATRFTYGPTTSGATLPASIATQIVTYGPEGIAKIKPIDWAVVAEKRGEWTNRWNKEMQ